MDHALPYSEFKRWAPEDQERVLQLLVYRSRQCPFCHTDPDEWWERDEHGQFVLDSAGRRVPAPDPYVPHVETCRGCRQMKLYLAQERRSWPEQRRGDDKPKEEPPGFRAWFTEPDD